MQYVEKPNGYIDENILVYRPIVLLSSLVLASPKLGCIIYVFSGAIPVHAVDTPKFRIAIRHVTNPDVAPDLAFLKIVPFCDLVLPPKTDHQRRYLAT